MSLSQAAAAALLNLEEEQNLYADIDENETEAVFNILKHLFIHIHTQDIEK